MTRSRSRSDDVPFEANDLDEAASADPEASYVVFSVDTHGYALPISAVRHVLPFPQVTRLPTDAPHIVGVFQHLGRILSLWDLHVLFGADGPPPARPGVLVVDHDGRNVGLLVEQVDEVVTLPAVDLVPAPEERLPPYLAEIIAGWLRVPEDHLEAHMEPSVPAGQSHGDEDGPGLHTLLSATGQPSRGAAILELHAPVHLIDLDRLWALAGAAGTFAAPDREEDHDRP